jgi:2-polyprenyl-3-methyl-5-hydroxy-6-metoxy-1,4-benzoquinol methylase
MTNSTSEYGMVVERFSASFPFDLVNLARYVPATSRSVLDCSCGDGARGKRLKKVAGRVVVGVERDPEKAALAEGPLDVVYCQPFLQEPLPFSEGQFDCIVCDGVLADVADPFLLVQHLLSWLSDEGLLILKVPNLQYYKTVLMLAEGHWTYEKSGIMARDNLQFFTAHEIVKVLRSAGCGVVKVAGLVVENSDNVRLDENRCLQFDRVTIGLLPSEQEEEAFLTEHFLVLASKGRG